MTADWNRIKELYGAASELEGAARDAYLAETCAGDDELRAQVAALLQADAEAESDAFLADGSTGHGLPSGPAVEIPRQLGRYSLVEKIGEGGFGEVYRAAQSEPVRREVALKVIKLGMDTRQVIARFEAERQALALMNHPGIARVFDGGATDAGRPYFVMELVAGLPITEYCQREKLGRRERLRLFVRVCQAVQHAHQKGVVHRDLKPGNILVAAGDGEPLIKVIDFGVAKALHGPLSESTLTEQPQYLGTPAYMSPEQAEPGVADIDTRADVYSLGALLYELLVGEPPFATDRLRSLGLSEALRVIREVTPQRPSAHQADLRGDLDWIVLRALEKDRTRRYDTVTALADDVGRYLRDEPVAAGPPSAAYRFRKFARRNRGLLASLGAITLLLVGGTAVATVGFLRARAESQRAQRAERDARDQQVLAERARDESDAARAESEAARAQSDAVTQFLVESLGQGDPYGLGRDVTMAEVLDHAAARLDARFSQQPGVLARLHLTIGRAYLELGRPGKAEAHIPEALRLYQLHYGDETRGAMRARSILGRLREVQGEYQQAEALRLAVLAYETEVNGPDHADTWEARAQLGSLRMKQGRLQEAAELQRAAAIGLEATRGPTDELAVRTWNDYAVCLDALGRYDEAEEIYLEVLAFREEFYGRDHPHTLTTLQSLAACYEITGRLEQAEALFLETIELLRAVSGPRHPQTLEALNGLTAVYDKQKRYDEAQALCREIIAASVEVLGDRHPDTMRLRNNLANSLVASGDVDEAIEIQEVVADYAAERLGPEHMQTLISRGNLAKMYNVAKRWDEAEPILLEVRSTLLRLHPAHGFTAAVTRHLGVTRMGQGRFDEAAELLEEARRGMAAALGPDHQLTQTVIETQRTLEETRKAAEGG